MYYKCNEIDWNQLSYLINFQKLNIYDWFDSKKMKIDDNYMIFNYDELW